MRVYLGGPWKKKELLHAAHGYVRTKLRGVGTVVSTWTEQEERDYTDAELTELALSDWRELMSADVLIIYPLGTKSEGKATELGGALATGKRVILVGSPTRNIFYHLPRIERVESLAGAVRKLLQ